MNHLNSNGSPRAEKVGRASEDAGPKRPIPFTQYMRPSGRPVEVSIARPSDIADKAMQIIDEGYTFECEMLSTGEVSLTITDDEGDHDIELASNGPDVPLAVDRLINRFFSEANL